ncbi:MAG: tRNA (guanosine(37)-N1)-methyltransferase TrmD [Phycisphaerales bacterium]|nr:MAG: tRNA (guanosine(37)-N1)-methyltransferase TrmD [Phycisphaerales bacterium]
MRFDILTLFPEVFEPVLGASITGRARSAGLVDWRITDIRTFSKDKHRRVDDRPFGGGPGMVMTCQPLWDAVQSVEASDPRPATRVLTTPQGEPVTQEIIEELARLPRLLIIAGHYEGVDERVVERLAPRELSIGDFVLSGGEIPALALVDAVTRLLPGVLGHDESASSDSFSVKDEQGRPLLDCPHYTRPRSWDGMDAPEILFSGDHAKVDAWRRQQMLERTKARRPDLLQRPNDRTTDDTTPRRDDQP